MKKMLMVAGLIAGTTLYTSAQTTGSQGSGSNNTGVGNTAATGAKNKKGKKTKKAAVVNQRVMYPSAKTGQTATPTGQEATGINGSEAPNPKNAAKRDSTHSK